MCRLNFGAAVRLPLLIQVSGEVSHNRVAFAGCVFKSRTLEHLNMSAPVGDETFLLQTSRGRGDAGAPDSQHFGKKFLGQIELVVFDSVLDHQQPARQSFLNFVQSVAGGKLAEDESMALHKFQDAPEERTRGEHFLLQLRVADSKRCAFDLDERGGGRAGGAKEINRLDHPFPTDEPTSAPAPSAIKVTMEQIPSVMK